MTVHIIDAIRPLPSTTEDYDHALDLAAGDTVLLAAGSEIAAYGYDADGINGHFGTTLLIDGRVFSETANAILSQGAINIGASGEVRGLFGISLLEDDLHYGTSIVGNAGLISGTSTGIYVDGSRAVINNSGKIIGHKGIFHNSPYDPGEFLTINNTGVIDGTGGIAILGANYGPNVVTNRGIIQGDVILGGNSWVEPKGPPTHVYDGRGGTISGVVRFASGNDIAYGGDGSETFVLGANTNFVDGGGGIDTLIYDFQATVDLRITSKQQAGTNAWDTIQNIENLNGGRFADRFIGNEAANTLVGNGGNDTLIGYDGNDLLSGGAGDDLLQGGNDSDTAVFTGKFADYTITVDGAAIIIADNRAGGDGIDHLLGVEFALFSDRIFTLPTGTSSPSVPTVPPASTPTPPDSEAPVPPPAPAIKNLTFKGGRKAETFVGGQGHDKLNGGLGKDQLTGGEGYDVFVFSTKLGKTNVDRITDFRSADDTIQLSQAVFGKIAKGLLSKSALCIGTEARDGNDRIIFDKKTGGLFYDADGSGTKYAAVKFAQLKAQTLLKADDFFIV